MPASIEVHARPDPLRSHGAWIVLVLAVGAGALCGSERGVVTGLFIGTVFAGGFLATGAWVVGLRRKLRQAAAGAVLAGTCLSLALVARDDWTFLGVVGLAALCAVAAAWSSARWGFLSTPALAFGLAALSLAAPAAALTEPADAARAAALFCALWPFSVWRSVRIATPLRSGALWDRRKLRALGLRESALHALWAGTAACGASWIG